MSTHSRPAGSTPKTSSACASFSPPRDTYGGGCSTSTTASSSTCVPGLSYPRTRPASTSACACARLSARPRSTSSTSSRFFISGRARREPVDDVLEHRRVRRDVRQPRARPGRGFVRERAGAIGPARKNVTVSVQDVVDDLKEQAELVAERAPGRLAALRDLRDPQRQADGRREKAARLELVQRRLVRRRLPDVEVLPADHPQRCLRELATDVRERVREREPERLRQERVAREHRNRLAELRP